MSPATASCHQKTTGGLCCSIPFIYKGVTYNSCTFADGYQMSWCSVDAVYRGRWAFCGEFWIDLSQKRFYSVLKKLLYYQKSSLVLFLSWCHQPHRAIRKLPQANVAVFHLNTGEWPTILALLLIGTDPGAPWLLCITESGATVVSFNLT